MAITVGAHTTTASVGTSIVLSKPSGLADGDLLVAFIAPSGDTISAAPSGWTQRSFMQLNSAIGYIYTKPITTASGEPADYTWTTGSGLFYSGDCLILTGADLTTPVDVAASTNTDTSATTVVTGVTTVTNNALLLGYATANSGDTWTTPGGMTNIHDLQSSTYNSSHFSYEQRATAGATGNRTFVRSTSTGDMSAGIIAIRPVTATSHPLTGTIAASSAASVTRLIEQHPLTATVAASSAASVTRLIESQPLTGTSAGSSAASVTRLIESQPLTGTSAASSAASATVLQESHPLTGSSAASSAAAATRLSEAQPLTGTSAGASTASATALLLAYPLAGTSAGTSAASATRIIESHPLTGSIAGTSTTAGDLAAGGTQHPLTGSVAASSAASATRLAEQHPLAATAAGSSFAAASLAIPAAEQFAVLTRIAVAMPVSATRTDVAILSVTRTAVAMPVSATRIERTPL